ncbi:MAG: T9SS type A sorting domain-containing protein [Paludibacteraceae bacterium]|nr:T9SS type A sorting domain-containing protein [Paludibacteraceae bacterium]
MIKRIFFAVGLSLSAVSLCAQSTTPVAGGSDQNEKSGSMSYTIGQVDYLYSHSMYASSVAGVQQPVDENLVEHSTCDGVELTVFPIPTVANLQVVSDLQDVRYPFYLTDMTGKLFFEGTLDGEYTTIPTESLTPGAYLLKIVCGEGKKDYTTIKVIKNQ